MKDRKSLSRALFGVAVVLSLVMSACAPHGDSTADSVVDSTDAFSTMGLSTEQSQVVPMVAAGGYHTVGLKSDGSVVAVGWNVNWQCNVVDWAGIIQVAAGGLHTVGLKPDGSLVAVGHNGHDQCNVVDWNGIVQMAAGFYHTVGLKADGGVIAIGHNEYDQCNVTDWTDVTQVAAGYYHTVGLKSDGSVVAVGSNARDQCNVSNWTDIIGIAAGRLHTVGLKSDGSVIAVGWNEYGQCNVADWTDIIQMAATGFHTVGLKSDGSVVAAGRNDYGQCNVADWTGIILVAAGGLHTVGLKPDGSAIAVGWNEYGQCNVADWNLGETSLPYDLTISSTDGGSVTTPGEGTYAYAYGTVVNLVATPAMGHHFANWTGDVGTIDNVDSTETTITMNGDYSIVANFAINQYTLTYTAGPGGSISGVTPQTVSHGSDGTPVEAVPNTGYHFVDWSDSSTDNPRTDTSVTADISVIANFAIDEHDLTISSTDGGSVTTPGEGTYRYAYGTVVNLVATPATGHHFVNWTGDVGSVGIVDSAETTITMNGDYSIVANFEPVAGAQTLCVESATGTGEVCITTSDGFIEDIEAMPAIPPGAPADIIFPHGMFSFKVTGLELGQTVTITVELPDPVPSGTRWWKEHMGAWYSIPVTVIEPNVIAFTLTDGVFPGDSDKTEDRVITDPGGPGHPVPPVPIALPDYVVGWDGSPISKAAVMMPWVLLLAAIAGASLLVLRRRRTHN